jgi:hypothetical protein
MEAGHGDGDGIPQNEFGELNAAWLADHPTAIRHA